LIKENSVRIIKKGEKLIKGLNVKIEENCWKKKERRGSIVVIHPFRLKKNHLQ
jgi:hypothetical protein